MGDEPDDEPEQTRRSRQEEHDLDALRASAHELAEVKATRLAVCARISALLAMGDVRGAAAIARPAP